MIFFAYLGALRVLAVNAESQINRQGAKDAKKTPSKTIWLRLGCTVILRVSVVKLIAPRN